jgi:hypothetical protein
MRFTKISFGSVLSVMSSPRHVLQPLILVSSVCGTLPYTPNLKFSTLLLFCCVFNNTVPPFYMLNSAIQGLKEIRHIPAYVSLLEVAKIICCVACIANLYFLFRRRDIFLFILSRFEEIHKIVKVSGAGMEKTRRQVQLMIYTISMLAWAINLFNIAIIPQKYWLSNLTYIVMYLFVSTAIHSLGTQFLSFSILLIFYLKHINSEIAYLQRVHLVYTNNEIVSKQIDDLRAAHNKLCENARLINQVYGIYLVLPLSYLSIHLQMDV